MAGRLQRRLQKQLVDDLPKEAAPGSDAEGSEEEEAASPPTKAFNPFAAFLTDEEVRRPTCWDMPHCHLGAGATKGPAPSQQQRCESRVQLQGACARASPAAVCRVLEADGGPALCTQEGAEAGPEADSEEEAEEQQQSLTAAATARQPGTSAKSKKRRAKKKGKGKAAAEGPGPDAAVQPGGEEGAAEDIDAILQELNIRVRREGSASFCIFFCQ